MSKRVRACRAANPSTCAHHGVPQFTSTPAKENIVRRGIRKPPIERSVLRKCPWLMKEWDFNKNSVLPSEVYAGSEISVYFICPKQHSYSSPLNARTGKKRRGCNVCSGHTIVEGTNDLKTLYPLIAEEMDRADNGEIKSNQVGAGVRTVFNFKCSLGHEWSSRIDNRTSSKSRCPICCNQKVLAGYNDLESQYPEFAKMFDPQANTLHPSQIVAHSPKPFYIKCDKGHSRKVVTATLLKLGTGCPYCSNRLTLIGYNDLATLHPKIANEFDIKLNNGITPKKISGKSRKSYWFTCAAGHSWKNSIANRTVRGDGCPDCLGAWSSAIEVSYRQSFAKSPFLSKIKDEANTRLPIAWRTNKTMKVDIVGILTSNKKPIVIEYDGEYWHSQVESKARDEAKTQALLESGYYVVRIRENSLPKIEIENKNLFQINANASNHKKNHNEIIGVIEKWLGTIDS